MPPTSRTTPGISFGQNPGPSAENRLEIADPNDPWARILARLRAAVLGEFEILREIGSGGMAAVYLARDLTLNRQVAIKVMSPALLMGEGMIERFRREATTIAALDHRNIVTIHAVREHQDLHFFVMKFIKGRSLEHVIRTAGPLPIPIVRGLLYMVGDALAHAHRRQVFHRDVKPGNILIDTHGNAIVTDFGIAKVADDGGVTHSAVILGTPAYMSPEQCYARPVTAASDQYSLGVVAYEMITGRTPFTGSQFVVMEAHTKVAPQSLRTFRSDCPPELDAAVLRMLAKEPSERWSTLQHALAELGATPLADAHPTKLAIAKLGIPDGEQSDSAEFVARPYVSSLAILAPPDWVEVGDELTMRASARNWAGDTMPGIAIIWSSSAPEIATIDTTGTVRAVAPGIVSITASFEDKNTSVALQVVPRRVASVTISPSPDSIHVGDRVQLVARLNDKAGEELKRSIAWSTSHPNIASISDTGVLRAIAPGLALAFAEADGVRGTTEVRIGPASVAMIVPMFGGSFETSLKDGANSLTVGEQIRVDATVIDSLNNVLLDRVTTWVSSAPEVATITPDGLVTAIEPGDVDFTCTCEGKVAVIAVRIEPRGPSQLSLGDTSELVDEQAAAVAAPVLEPQSLETETDGADLAGSSAAMSVTDQRATAPMAAAAPAVEVGVQTASKESQRRPRTRSRRRRDLLLGGVALIVVGIAASIVISNRRAEAERKQREEARVVAENAAKAAAAESLRADSVSRAAAAARQWANDHPARVEIAELPELVVGDTITLHAVALDSSDAQLTTPVRWRSSNPRLASVDSMTGAVIAKGAGAPTIYAFTYPPATKTEAHVPVHVASAGRGRDSSSASSKKAQASTDQSASAAPKKVPASVDQTPKAVPTSAPNPSSGNAAPDPLQESDPEIRSVFDRDIGPAIREKSSARLRQYFDRALADSILDIVRKIPSDKIHVKRRNITAERSKGRASGMFSINEIRGTKDTVEVMSYSNFIAKLETIGGKLTLTHIQRE